MKKGKHLIGTVFLMLCFFILQDSSAFSQGAEFAVKRIGQVTSFAKNTFSVDAPEAGELTITIRTDTSIFRTITQEVQEGNTRIEWDGCGYNRERLTPITYHIIGELKGNSGQIYTLQFDSPIQYVSQALYFALPSSSVAYLDSPEDWFVESRIVTAGTVVFEFLQDGDIPVYTFRRGMKANRINTTTLSV